MRKSRTLASLVASIMLLVIGQDIGAEERPNLRVNDIISGRVIDKDSKLPIEGAYAVIVYGPPSKNPNILFDHCLKTKGTYVDSQGFFRFKAEWIEGLTPDFVTIVAPDYFFGGSAGGGGVIELIKRDPPAESFNADATKRHLHDYQYHLLASSQLDCWRAKTKEDAAAAIPALQILRGLFLMYYLENNGAIGVDRAKEIDRIIFLLNQLPSK